MSHSKFTPDISDMLDVSIQKNGNIVKIAKHFNVHRDTIYEYFKRDPDGKKIVEKVRGVNTETDLDIAEQVNRNNMLNFEKNPKLAQRAAETVIKGKGHLRGWGQIIEERQPPYQNIIDISHENMMLKDQLEKLKAQINGNQS